MLKNKEHVKIKLKRVRYELKTCEEKCRERQRAETWNRGSLTCMGGGSTKKKTQMGIGLAHDAR